MGRKQGKELVRHVTLEELNKMVKKEEKSVRVIERLYFIRNPHDLMSPMRMKMVQGLGHIRTTSL